MDTATTTQDMQYVEQRQAAAKDALKMKRLAMDRLKGNRAREHALFTFDDAVARVRSGRA